MTYFVRKFSRAKWADAIENNFDLEDICSDAYTSCLRTSSNTLSIWKIDCDINDKDKLKYELGQIVLAIVTSLDKIDRLNLIFFTEDDIANLDRKCEKGDTPIDYLVDRHENLINLTFSKLKIIAEIYRNSYNNNYMMNFPKKEVEKLVDEAIKNKLFNDDNKYFIKNREILQKIEDYYNIHNTLNIKLCMYATDKEKLVIEKKAKQNNVSISQYIRYTILKELNYNLSNIK